MLLAPDKFVPSLLTLEWAFPRPQGLLELQRAQRSFRLEGGWDKVPEKLERVVEVTVSYCQGKEVVG